MNVISPDIERVGQVHEFKLGETQAEQKGRVTRLSNPKLGTTYLIDVTDRDDPTRRNSDDPPSEEDIIGNVFKEDLGNPDYNNRFSSNNGVIAIITDTLDPQGRKRVYVGVSIIDIDDPQRREITTDILGAEGLRSDSFYVPFSFDSGLVREYITQEVMTAVKESGQKELFSDFSRLIPSENQP